MIERQVIVTWHTPDEKLPEEGIFVVVSFSGKAGNIRYDHTFGIAEWYNDENGWELHNAPKEFTIHAWCNLEPYGGK